MVAGNGSGDSPGNDGSSLVRAPTRTAHSFADTDRAVIFPIRDGNDIVAVHEAVRIGLERARSGGGATLVEAVTYRLADHNTADDARRYRDPAEVDAHASAEPVGRVRRWLESVQAWNEARQTKLQTMCSAVVEAGVEKLFAAAPEPPSVMFEHVYAAPSAELVRQRDAGLQAIAAEREAKRRV